MVTNGDIARAVALALDAAGARPDCNMRPVASKVHLAASGSIGGRPCDAGDPDARWIEVDVWYATELEDRGYAYLALYGLDTRTGAFELYQD